MNSKLKHTLLLAAALCCALLGSCSKDDTTHEITLGFDDSAMTVGEQAGLVKIIVRSNSNWNVVSEPKDWFSFNITEGRNDGAVRVSYKENTSDQPRTASVQIKADGRTEEVKITQMGRSPKIIINNGVNEMTLAPGASPSVTIPVDTNISAESVIIALTHLSGGETAWISDVTLTESGLNFKVEANNVGLRSMRIDLSWVDPFDRKAEASITLSQSFNAYAGAVETTYATVREKPLGTITDDICIKGVIISDGRSSNFMTSTKTLSIQSPTEGALLFELADDKDNSFARYDNVELALKDCVIEERIDQNLIDTNEKYTYRVIKGITASHIQQKAAGTKPNLPQIYMDEITDDMVFSMVELKDVEFSIPIGCYTNWHEYYLNQGALYAEKFKAFPQSVRDIKGNHLRLLTSPSCTYRRDGTALPAGSGTLRGIIVRENVTNYGVTSSEYSIRHLIESDIDFAESRDNSFSAVLAEWDCKGSVTQADMDVLTAKKGLPATIGNGLLYHNQATGFVTKTTAGKINFVAGYTGLGTTDYTSGASYELMNYYRWYTDQSWWIVSGVSSKNVPSNSVLSVQLEIGSNNDGPVDFATEYSIDGAQTWNRVGVFKSRGQLYTNQFNRIDFIPGHMVYDFKLPAAAVGVENLAIRFIFIGTTNAKDDVLTSTTGTGTNRLGHVSIKYNK